MADSIREQIIQDIMSRVAEIQKINGYGTDVGRDAVRATKYAPASTGARIVVIPRIETGTTIKYGKTTYLFPVDIHAFVTINPGVDNASQISERIYSDIIYAITRLDSKVTDLAERVAHTGGGGVELADNEATLAGAQATFEITYKTVVGSPTTQ